MKETLYSIKYNDNMCAFEVEKEVEPLCITVIVYDVSNTKKEVSRVTYKNIGEEYISPFLSWRNLFFCSNSYGPAPDYKYMHQAVQDGEKVSATVYLEPQSSKGLKLVDDLPQNCDSLPYGDSMIYVFHKGCLADFFNIEKIQNLYENHSIWQLDWGLVKQYFRKPLSFFGDEKLCGFSLQYGVCREQILINGLLLGYPIESTIEFLGS